MKTNKTVMRTFSAFVNSHMAVALLTSLTNSAVAITFTLKVHFIQIYFTGLGCCNNLTGCNMTSVKQLCKVKSLDTYICLKAL